MTISHHRRRGSSSTSSATTSATAWQEMVASSEMSTGTNDDEWLPPPKFPSTGESTNDVETMDNTLRGAEDGMFGGFLDANGNDAMVLLLELSPHLVMIYLHFEIYLIMVKEVV